MPTFTGYYSTLQVGDNHSYDGIWNISHSSVKYMVSRYGMKWTEMRKVMKAAFTSSQRDPGMIENIKQTVHQKIPLRTGHLMDHIFKTMRIIRSSWYSSHFFADFSYDYPADRPRYIKGRVQHSPPDQGYGDWSGVKLSEPIPKSRVSRDHVTFMGNALYNLDDPFAEAFSQADIEKEALLEIEDDYATLLNGILMTLMI